MAKMRKLSTPLQTTHGTMEVIADVDLPVGKPGDKGIVADVQLVQLLLWHAIENRRTVKRGPLLDSQGRPITGIDVDGICGRATREAILSFQRRRNVDVQRCVSDGVVSPTNGSFQSTAQGLVFTISLLNFERRIITGSDLDPEEVAIEPLRTALLASVGDAQFA